MFRPEEEEYSVTTRETTTPDVSVSSGKNFSIFTKLLQWVLIPLVGFLLAFPAIDSQTRILLGKYFGEFWVAKKMRKS